MPQSPGRVEPQPASILLGVDHKHPSGADDQVDAPMGGQAAMAGRRRSLVMRCPIPGTVWAVLDVGVAAVGGGAATLGPGRPQASRGSARATIRSAGPVGRGRLTR